MRVLIIGSGAVGQVYALALQNSDVELGLFDRPVNAQKLLNAREQGGLPLFQITRAHRKDPIPYRLKDFQVFTEIAECRGFTPDVLWFTVPSQAYYSDWFRDFLQQIPSKRVVCFTPEGRRPEFFPDGSGEQVVFGGTTFMAWQGDLQNSAASPEGIRFWRPPLAIPLEGTPAACRDVAQVLKKAGFNTTIGQPHSQAAMTAAMTAFVAGLELAGWSLSNYRKSPWLKQAAAACSEAARGELHSPGGLTRLALSSGVLSVVFFLVALLLPLLFPFEIESYLKFHYTKTREQTLVLLALFAQDCTTRSIPAAGIQHLLASLQNTR